MNIGDVLTLSDDNKYVIASKVEHSHKLYLCLTDINNRKNVKFGYLDNDEIVLVKKESLSSALVLKLFRNTIIFKK